MWRIMMLRRMRMILWKDEVEDDKVEDDDVKGGEEDDV